VHARVAALASTCPDAVAVADEAQSLSFAVLDAKATAVAHRLRALGVGRGSLVGLCHDRTAAGVVGALAILKAGGGYVGMDPAYPEARLAHMLRDSGATVLLTDRSVIEQLGSSRLGADAIVDLDDVAGHPWGETQPALPDEPVGPDDVAYVIYTSGSTGLPKGVAVSHRSLLGLVDWHQHAFAVTPADRASAVASPAFDASVWEVWPYLASGASLHMADRATATSPTALRDWLVTKAITIGFAPTALAEELLDLRWPLDTRLRIMLTGGDRLRRRPPPNLPFTLVNNYGVTEASVVSTSGTVSPDRGAGDVPGVGRAIPGTHLHVLDEQGRPVTPGEVGELYIGGSGVAIGYVNQEALTAERFLPDPFVPDLDARMYRTGDLVRVTADGEIHFLGRMDDQVQLRGHRIELGEVAAVLSTHPSVGRCVVVIRELQPGNPGLVAYVVPSGERGTNREELLGHLAERVPAAMVPTAFVQLEALPVTLNGKLDVDALPAPALTSAATAEPPRTAVELIVSTTIEELLELDGVAREDNFFELGGHSLLAAQLVTRLQDRLGVELTLLTIFDNPTVADIACVIEGEGVEPIASSAAGS
jgi:amino acid adenylation domain-containing protein